MSINLTQSASDEISKIKRDQELGNDSFLRISILGGGCSGMQYALNFDTKYNPAIDTQYNFGEIIVATERKYDPHLDGTKIDFVMSPHASGFTIENPNFPKGAGCPGCGCH
ncbi:MAG: iron-sulfur cluster assembly accessory protein [Planctomycetaceae bacterium]|nr:iron-sulfur cluster assembly accessory protein [Planctomycetaceae bacterium]